MSDAPPAAPKRTGADLATNLALWVLLWGGLAAALWFYPLPTLGIAALLLLFRCLSC